MYTWAQDRLKMLIFNPKTLNPKPYSFNFDSISTRTQDNIPTRTQEGDAPFSGSYTALPGMLDDELLLLQLSGPRDWAAGN